MTDNDMGSLTEDVRTKLTPADHERLVMVSTASGEDIASIVRRVVLDLLARKEHEYTVAARFAQAKGIAASSRGNVQK